MQIQINYSFDSMHGYPFRACAIAGGRIIAIAVSGGSFEDAKARLIGRLEHLKPGKIPGCEFIEIDGLTLPQPQPAKETTQPQQLKPDYSRLSSKTNGSNGKPAHQ